MGSEIIQGIQSGRATPKNATDGSTSRRRRVRACGRHRTLR